MPWTTEELQRLAELYPTHTQKELAVALGKTLPQVRTRLSILGIRTKVRGWTAADEQLLRDAYQTARCGEEIGLDALAERLGRLKSNVCRKARALGLTDNARKMKAECKQRVPKFATPDERAAATSARIKNHIKTHGHPKGFLGGKHTDDAKMRIAEKSRQFNASLSEDRKQEIATKIVKTRVANGTYALPRHGTTWKAAWRDIGGRRKFFRSRWEANYARYLNWLEEKGQILKWEHEPITFWFEGVKRGCVSYLPDFRVTETSGEIVYYEVKGWMDDRSKTKLKRMAKYHPTVKLVVIREKDYREVERKLSSLIDGWER